MRMRQAIGLSLALLLVSTTAMAEEVPSCQHPATPGKPKAAKPDTNVRKASARRQTTERRQATERRHTTERRAAARAERRRPEPAASHRVAQNAPPDQYIGAVKVVGRREVGSAAWYGGYHIGRRTASGDRLDAVHPTAAHRSLPLNSMVRVTNLRNGRSMIVKITDRGPVSRSLLIDVSPRVADSLDMKQAGIVPVSVEPVAPAPN